MDTEQTPAQPEISATETPAPPKPVRVKVGSLPVFYDGKYHGPGAEIEVHSERAHELAATGHVTTVQPAPEVEAPAAA